MEFPVHDPRLLHLSRYSLMALCAVGCLTGEIEILLEFLSQKDQSLKIDTKEML